MADAGLTFDMVKAQLSTVVRNGTCEDKPIVLTRLNEATQEILSMITPVGGMATYDVVSSYNADMQMQVILLPKELENAIEVEVVSGTVNGQTDVTQGWYDLVNQFAYVDPASAHDNPLIDMFLVPDGDDASVLRRKYAYPGLSGAATVRATGAKRYVPNEGGGDGLIIQNVRAIKDMILSLERRDNNDPDGSMKYRQLCLETLQAEVKKHQLDPRNSLKRKAAYQVDLTQHLEGSLGRTRARLALELPGFLLRGKAEISYLVNRAVQMLVDNRNQLAITGRISIKAGVTELTYSPALAPETQLAWNDYNQIRLLVQSFITESGDPAQLQVSEEYKKQAFALQQAQLIEETERLRHTTYTSALSTYVSGSFGWTVARLALEMQGGLTLTQVELERTLSMAEMRLMERGFWKGTIKTLSATITGGEILFPRDVEAVLAASVCGDSIDVRSIFFKHQPNGPGDACSCHPMFTDMGEVFFPMTGAKRRKYKYHGSCTDNQELTAVCKVRWEQKEVCDEMVIKNFEALRLMSTAIQFEKAEKWQDAGINAQMAIDVLEQEMRQYLGGQQMTPSVQMGGYGFHDLGEPN